MYTEKRNNYGIIISNEDGYEIDDVCYKGIKYIIDHLIKPLQTNIISYFQKLQKREITSIRSRSAQINEDNIIYNKIIKEEKQKYQAFALKMTDFNSYISKIYEANPIHYDNTKEFDILTENEDYLLKMFKLLQHINNNCLYYYKCSNLNPKTSIIELNKINYKYLHFTTTNKKFFRCIDFNKHLNSFEDFQNKIKKIKQEVEIVRDAIAYIELSPIKTQSPKNYIIKKEDKEKENYIQRFFQKMKVDEETIELLYYSTPILSFVNLLESSIFINNDLYYIHSESFLMEKEKYIKITNNINLCLNLENKEILV
jgi:hypothetical protein